MQQIDFDVVIVGGGLVGSCFALDLAKQNPNLNIALLEKQPIINDDLDRLDSKIYAISPENIDYLKSINGWPEDETRVGTIKTMDVSGDKFGHIELDAKSSNRQFLARTIEYNHLQQQLYKELKNLLNLSFIYDDVVDLQITETHATLSCKDKYYTTRLIVGSDGANSFIRKKSGLDDMRVINYDQAGVVANFSCEKPHKNIAYQWFHQSNILAYLPLPNNQISIVWAHPYSQELCNLSEEDFCTQVAKAGEYKLGKLSLITKPIAFPLKLRLLNKFYTNKIVLIGDAAHTIHPLAGYGVNLGFGDAKELAHILSTVANYQIGDVGLLAKYNTLRFNKVRKMQFVCHGLHNLFNINQPIINKVRNVGLNIVNSLPMLKKYLISNAVRY